MRSLFSFFAYGEKGNQESMTVLSYIISIIFHVANARSYGIQSCAFDKSIKILPINSFWSNSSCQG